MSMAPLGSLVSVDTCPGGLRDRGGVSGGVGGVGGRISSS